MRMILLSWAIASCVCNSNDLMASRSTVDDDVEIQNTLDENGRNRSIPLPDLSRKRERIREKVDETPPLPQRVRIKHAIPAGQQGVRAKRNLVL